MEHLRYFKQMVNFNKTAYDNFYNAVIKFNNEAEEVAGKVLARTGIPIGGNEVVQEWTKVLKKGQENYKRTVDLSFERIEAYIDTFQAQN